MFLWLQYDRVLLILGSPIRYHGRFHILNFTKKVFGSTRATAAPHTANSGEDGLFLLPFSQHEPAMATD